MPDDIRLHVSKVGGYEGVMFASFLGEWSGIVRSFVCALLCVSFCVCVCPFV